MPDGPAPGPAAPADAPGRRFSFGLNWQRFLASVDDDRVQEAGRAILGALRVESLEGCSFLDIGCGSGLSSLAARRAGAGPVHSLDYDPQSVAAAGELRRRYAPGDEAWTIERGDVLDQGYLATLGSWDVVYSWGVLHHTGDMWTALGNVDALVRPGGRLMIAIYNDQGLRSRLWRRIKEVYNALPPGLRTPYVVLVMAPREAASLGIHLLRGRLGDYVCSWTEYKRQRGMSRWHDMVDWVGGLPFEVARPEEVFDFFRVRGYALVAMRTCAGGLGNNEFVFERAG
jgi:SAM-dependent methyltransferase